MPTKKKHIQIKKLLDLKVGDVVVVEDGPFEWPAVEREMPLELPTAPGTLIKVTWNDISTHRSGSDVLLRGNNYSYVWHSENNRWTSALVDSITDFEVLYAPAENTEGGC